MSRIEQIAGALLFLLGLADVFLTVLYARAGTGVISRAVTIAWWRAMLAVSSSAGRWRGRLLSFCGPLNLLLLVLTWSAVLALGAGLILQPELGRTVRPSSGVAQTDFTTALYVGGSSLSLVGSSDYEPTSAPLRLLFLFNALAGTSMISLTLTYLMQVYTALRERNTLALAIDTLTTETGDAARLLVAIAPGGDLGSASTSLGQLASQMIEVKEAHHFYPVLFYFRFEDPRYSVSRFAFIVLDALCLLDSALRGREAERLQASGAVAQLHRATLMLVRTLERTFVPAGGVTPAEQTGADAWRARFARAIACLGEAGLPTIRDSACGAANYASRRALWDGDIAKLARAMGYEMAVVDTAATLRCGAEVGHEHRLPPLMGGEAAPRD